MSISLFRNLSILFTMTAAVFSSTLLAGDNIRNHRTIQELEKRSEENQALKKQLKEKLERSKSNKQKENEEDDLQLFFGGIEGAYCAVGINPELISLISSDNRVFGVLLANFFIMEIALEAWLEDLKKSGISQPDLDTLDFASSQFAEYSLVYIVQINEDNNGLPSEFGLTQEEIALGLFESASLIGDTLFRLTGDPYYANAWRWMALDVLKAAQSYSGVLTNECVDPDSQISEGAISPFFFLEINSILRGTFPPSSTCSIVF